jgi:hypothetical protein
MKKARKSFWLTMLAGAVASATFSQVPADRQQQLQELGDHVFELSEVMLHDVANPPAASRVYAYALLGAYQAARYAKGQLPDISHKFQVDPQFQSVAPPKKMNLPFCSNYALLEVGRQLMPSGYLLDEKKKALVDQLRNRENLSEREATQQVRYAMAVAKQVIDYARKDGYNKLSTYKRYTPSKEEGHWYPTPPAYMGAVEPEWQTVRPFFLDSAAQFPPAPPVPFSKDPSSKFHKLMKEVYDAGNAAETAQREIAAFWDCNPFAVAFSGHVAMGLKKISPGGHWMGIASIACKKADLPLDSAILVHTVLAMAIHDGFISCWNEKYRSDRIRPETAINKYMDPAWRPQLQTPPFPEYTSGHSVVSSAASVILTYMLGDNFEFLDTTEIFFGLPERRFNSFSEAAKEAAISRLYGGIHYRDACEQGTVEGRQVAEHALAKLFQYQP